MSGGTKRVNFTSTHETSGLSSRVGKQLGRVGQNTMKIKKWEYREKWNISGLELKELGVAGWELISVVKADLQGWIYYFKRRIYD